MSRDRRVIPVSAKWGICVVCCNETELEIHHINPLVFGGEDDNSNVVGVCSACHEAIHAVRRKRLSRGSMVRTAMAKCKDEMLVYAGPMFGYIKHNGKLVPLPEEQRVIQSMRAMHADGESYSAIARKLTADQVPTKRGGICWHPTTVRNILLNDIHRGASCKH